MLRVYDCLAHQHDYWLLGLAILVCALGCHAAMDLLQHARDTPRKARRAWLLVTAVALGSAMWATHFIAMLAYQPGLQVGYSTALTVLSLIAAIAMTGCGLALALKGQGRRHVALGGTLIGAGIAVMHYIGMAAFEVPALAVWDWPLVAASIAAALALGPAALLLGLAGPGLRFKLAGTLLLMLAIVTHHVIGMGALSLVPMQGIEVSKESLPPPVLALCVAAACVALLVLALAGLAQHVRDRQRQEVESAHMRDLADAAVEGLVVFDGGIIVATNKSFETMVGSERARLTHRRLSEFLEDPEAVERLEEGRAIEGELIAVVGERIPVEMLVRKVNYAGKPHGVLALRDLRDRRRAEAEIRFLAHNDALTRIPNRRSFNQRLDQQFDAARRSGTPFAVLALDLDRFKPVNDTLGHPIGDALLVQVAERLTAVLTESCTVSRLGGDEFAILLGSFAKPEEAGRLARAVIDEIARPFAVEGHLLNIGVSIGVAVAPADGADALQLMKNVDLALYRAKQEGRGIYRFFEADMDTKMQERRAMEIDLGMAIARNELELYYQPLYGVEMGEIAGFEALLRWQHPQRGLVSPMNIIPLAEETGLIVPIGEWVLRTACRDAAGWPEHLSIAVNISAVQFRSASLADTVLAAITESNLAPRRLDLEITESALLRDNEATIQTLTRLRELGVRISMDDFGTGYSSLSYLRSFPFDKIKIDRSFVRELHESEECAAIVRAIVGLGKSLGIETTAEGVETRAQLDYILAQGCDQIQGFLIGKPHRLCDLGPFLASPASAAA